MFYFQARHRSLTGDRLEGARPSGCTSEAHEPVADLSTIATRFAAMRLAVSGGAVYP